MKKKLKQGSCWQLDDLPQILRIMKLIGVFMFVALLQVSASSYSQTKELTIKRNHLTLEELFEMIENQSEFSIMYNLKQIDLSKEVDVDFENQTVDKILNLVLKGSDITYTVNDRLIIIHKENDMGLTEKLAENQQRSVSGKVTDFSGVPLPGVTVLVKGTTNGTVTNADGEYSLTDIPENSILQFSFVGMKTQEIAVTNQSSINVVLEEDAIGIEEIVAVGYGTQKKGNLTGAISTVKSESLVKVPVGTTSNVLVGRVAGLKTQQTSGQPGLDGVSLNIRGFGSPLIIVDGVEGEINNIAPNEIASISVLKDASAAIYGARAGNGVILVTTKRGQIGKPTVTLKATQTWQGVTSFGKPVSAGQFAELKREEHLNQGLPESTSPFTLDDIANYYEGNNPAYPNANWWKNIMNDWAPQQQYDLSVTGGSDRIKYFGSIGYINQEFMYKADGNKYKRFNIRSNIDASITKDLSLRFDFADIIEFRKYPFRDDNQIWSDLFNAEPTRYFSFPDKSKVPYTGEQLMNPIIDTDRDLGGFRDTEGHSIKSTIELEYNIPKITGLTAKAFVNYSQYFMFNKGFQREIQLWNWDYQSDTYWVEAVTPATNLSQNESRSRTITGQFSLAYEKEIAKNHSVQALLLYELIDYADNYIYGSRRDYEINSIPYLSAGSEAGQYVTSGASETGRTSYIGRLNYAYKGKYLLESTFRYDASAKFAPEERWGFFPSVSLGWRVSEENFIKNMPQITNLKIRGGFSQTGRDNVGSFQYLSAYSKGWYYLLGDNVQSGLVSTGMANPTLSWEKMTIYNLGLDFAFWNRKLYGEIDAFYREREGIPATRIGSLPSTFGETLPQENINSQTNRGIDVSIGHSASANNFSWDVKANFSWSRAKWDHYEEAELIDPDDIRMNMISGQWTDRIFGYKSDGLFTSQEEIDALLFDQDLLGNSTLAPGDVRYVDINGDQELNWRDMVELGHGSNLIGSLDMYLKYKNFDLSVLLQGTAGGKILVGIGASSVPQEYVYEERWTPENNDRNAIVPRRGGAATNGLTSDYKLRSTNYLRLKSLNLGYNIPSETLQYVGVQTLRVYFAGTNLLTFDHLKKYSLDPESANGNGFYYPQQRTLTVGLQISF